MHSQFLTHPLGLKINPKPCSVNNVEGRCMFVWECINTDGHHLGMCVDTFMFGSCCSHNLNKSDTSPASVQEKTSPTLLYTKPSTSVTHRPSPYTHKTSPITHKTSPTAHKTSPPTLLTKPSPSTTILYSKPIRQTQRPLLSYYSHKDISSDTVNMTQRPYVKPPKESLGRPVNLYSNNDKIDDFSTESVNR